MEGFAIERMGNRWRVVQVDTRHPDFLHTRAYIERSPLTGKPVFIWHDSTMWKWKATDFVFM